MAVMAAVSTFGLNFQLTSAMMARTEFGKGAGEYGVLGSVLAIGSLAGALLAARRERPRVRLVIGAAFAFGVAMGAQALMPTYVTVHVLCIPVGLASLTMMTAANSAIQVSTTPAHARPGDGPVHGGVHRCDAGRLADRGVGGGDVRGPLVGRASGRSPRLLVAGAAALWAQRAWNLEVRYHLRSRPHLEVRCLDATQERGARGGRGSRSRTAGPGTTRRA